MTDPETPDEYLWFVLHPA